MAAKIKERLDIEIKLSSGAIGELSVYWNHKKISKKGDSLDYIIQKLQEILETD